MSKAPGKSRTTAARAAATPPAVPPAAPTAAPPATPPTAARLRKQAQILDEAERQFARFGFEGVSLDTIAAGLGISRHNLLYYYASKDELYGAVLGGVLASWLQSMEVMARDDDPARAISRYIAAKLRFSQERPSGSAVFTREVMAGAPRYAQRLAASVLPNLAREIQTFEKWARKGLIRRVDFTHLMFVIWSATQAYADQAPQFALFMGKPQLDDADFAAAHALITQLVMGSLVPAR
jgi:TetR/AcrR family transcriptional regulator